MDVQAIEPPAAPEHISAALSRRLMGVIELEWLIFRPEYLHGSSVSICTSYAVASV